MAIIKKYEKPTPANPYKDAVTELANAGKDAAYELIVSTEKNETQRGSAAGEKAKFQNAAREQGFSARVTETEAREDGNTRYVFVLTERSARASDAAISE